MTTEKGRPLCKGTTAANKPCKTKAMVDSEYCHKHQPAEVIDTSTGEVTSKVQVEQTIEQAAGQALAADPAFAKYEIAKRIAHTLACSTIVPDAYIGKPNDIFVAINMGSELGMEPFQAIQSIAVIEGKPCLYGDGLIGVVRASPKCKWIQEELSEDGTTATCTTQRDGDPQPISASYSMDDAIQAGINNKYNWKKHPKRMLQMRARAYCLRDAYPDLLKGLGMVEEHQDHDDTPPPITQYKLPEPKQDQLIDQAKEVFGDGVTEAPTLAQVEHAMHQSDSMEELLAAANLAKGLTDETDRGTARITYQKMRDVLREPKTQQGAS